MEKAKKPLEPVHNLSSGPGDETLNRLSNKSAARVYARKGARWLFIPLLIYASIFFILQPHYLGNFSNGFYLDNGDGFQNVWNIWWVNESIVGQGASPYFTNMVHWPHGTTLLPQTMNIINGLMAIPLMKLLGFSLVQATNFAVVFAFVFAGVTMFWFIQKLYGKYWVSIVAGGLFTFSTYHMAHAQGHLQLVTLQFIPLFLLAFWLLVEKVRYRYAATAAGALFLVLLSDYYYLFWCVILGAMWAGWRLYKKELSLTKQNLKVLSVFAGLSVALVGPMVFNLIRLNKVDPLGGFHDPMVFVLDPLSVVIPGGSWYWSSFTDWHWKHLPFLAETSVFFGFGLLAVLAFAFYKSFLVRKKKSALPSAQYFWWLVLVVFGILSLGPRLKVFARTLDRVPLPYELMEMLFPTLKISGMPVRWILVSLIAAIVIASYWLARLDLKSRKGRVLLTLFVLVSFVDLWSVALPLTLPKEHTQAYVEFLKQQPNGAVIDNGAESEAEQLFHQTVHEKPIAFGYVTRLPKSAAEKDFHIFAALEEGRYDQLCKIYKVRYVTLPAYRPLKNVHYPIIYDDRQTLIYDFKDAPDC